MSEGLGRHRLGARGAQGPQISRGPVRPRSAAIRLVWVYPDLLSTYGDRGNLLMLARRARLRGIGVEVAEVNSDQRVPADGDIYLLGGGEDLPQVLAARRLRAGGQQRVVQPRPIRYRTISGRERIRYCAGVDS